MLAWFKFIGNLRLTVNESLAVNRNSSVIFHSTLKLLVKLSYFRSSFVFKVTLKSGFNTWSVHKSFHHFSLLIPG